jgi:uncharacterized membrane protein YhiD involved in acid resistance
MRIAGVALLIALVAAGAPAAAAQALPDASDPIPNLLGQLPGLWEAAVRLPLAALLGAALAFRPRHHGAPPRIPTVIQTQILLAVVGAVVMLIVGQSLARAFGIVGVASLVRYRAKIDDPKDAGVMLACLGIGLACGVGLLLVAGFATAFLLGFLWWVESLEPEPLKRFHLRIKTSDPAALRTKLEKLLRRQRARFELRSSSAEEISYEVLLPFDRKTDVLSNAIVAMDGPDEAAVEWDEKKSKDRAER